MISSHRFRPLLLAGALSTAASGAFAQPSKLPPEVGFNSGEQETPRIAAMGGALRALSNATDALYMNPANLATARVYHIGGTAQFWPDAKRQSYGAAAVDSILNQQHVAGGLAATFTSQDPSGLERRALDLRFALALPVSDLFFVGATVKHLGLFQDGVPAVVGLEPSQAAAGLHGKRIISELSFDAGVSLRPIPQLGISVVGYNLTNPGSYVMPLMIAGGLGYGNESFSIEADANFDFTSYEKTKTRLGAGAELLLADHFPIRGGYRYDQARGIQSLSVGTGYLATEFAVDAALRVSVVGQAAMAIIIGLRYHLDGAGVVGASDVQ